MWAAVDGYEEVVKVLAEAGADVNVQTTVSEIQLAIDVCSHICMYDVLSSI